MRWFKFLLAGLAPGVLILTGLTALCRFIPQQAVLWREADQVLSSLQIFMIHSANLCVLFWGEVVFLVMLTSWMAALVWAIAKK